MIETVVERAVTNIVWSDGVERLVLVVDLDDLGYERVLQRLQVVIDDPLSEGDRIVVNLVDEGLLAEVDDGVLEGEQRHFIGAPRGLG